MGTRFSLLALLTLFCTQIVGATTFTVTNTNDAGSGSLRQAITDANADNATPHLIDIDVTGTIALNSALPSIARSMTIDGPGALDLTITRSASVGFSIFVVDDNVAVTIDGVTVTNGFGTNIGPGPATAGGGILNNGTLTISYCTISGNQADDGCGIWSDGVLTVGNCTISDNSTTASAGRGGGIYIEGTATIRNSTISGNNLQSVSFGGGIYANGTTSIVNTTITDNYGTVGGGLYIASPNRTPVSLLNTIIAGNTSNGTGDDVFGEANSLGHNLIGSTAGNSGWIGSDILNQSASLGGLQNNGGPTSTHALQSGSPAIDAGDNAVLNPPYDFLADQRGYSRLAGTIVDIGAFEFEASDQPLPVELVEFSLASHQSGVRLAWRTASERDNLGFEVQRAIGESSSFMVVASYVSNPELTGLGTSSSGKSYAFFDGDLQPGVYRYRLVDVTRDGIRTEHDPKSVRVEGASESIAETLRLDAVSPNPVTDGISVSYMLPDAGAVTIEIYSVEGRVVARPLDGVARPTGANRESISLAGISTGSYTLRLVTTKGARIKRFVVVR